MENETDGLLRDRIALSACTLTDVIGTLAGSLTTLSVLPQVHMVWTSDDVSGVSCLTYTMYSVGVMGWMIYGLRRNTVPLVVSNAVTFSLALSVLIRVYTKRYVNPTAHRSGHHHHAERLLNFSLHVE